MEFVKGIFGIGNEAEVKRIGKIVNKAEVLEQEYIVLPDAQLRGKTAEFRARIEKGETLDALLPEAFAAVAEAARRTIGQTPFRTQMMGAVALHQGRIAEMKTGEGKTLTAALTSYLNALEGKGVHIVTVNDYLARFQGEWMGKIYRYLGMSVGLILHGLSNDERRAAYASDITYGTNNEFGFDYLRDNMVVYEHDMVQRQLHFAIVDEVDSILIDEARTPLIISGMGKESTDLYQRADVFASRLRRDVDYEIDEKLKNVTLQEEGVRKAESFFGVDNLSDMENTEINHHINQALKAHTIFKRDVDYVVREGEVLIVDEFTGRLMVGRRYSEGLHQAIEAKEHVTVARESKTLATITFQNYFRMYKKLSGMTGTAKTEEQEFSAIYKLDVVQIPTNKPMIRKDQNDLIYRTESAKLAAVVRDVKELNAQRRPVLVGTVSVEMSELLSGMLKRAGIQHVVLNAKHHEKEAEIVAQAGKAGAVTIATNMAGRGTDILLGGNPEFLARQAMEKEDYASEIIDEAQGFSEDASPEVLAAREEYRRLLSEFKKETDAGHGQVVGLGGLHIIGTERHESRRIDNQLRGRSGRQGDPGSSRFYISLEDDLMRRFGGDRIAPLVEKLGMDEETPLEQGMLSRQIESAQKRVEGQHFDARKHVLQYDDVMNQQREIIYGQRKQVLAGADMREEILHMLVTRIEQLVEETCPKDVIAEDWDLHGLNREIGKYFPPQDGEGEGVSLEGLSERELLSLKSQNLKEALCERGKERYAERIKAAEEAGANFSEIERVVLLRAVDTHWMDHIDDMDQLRHGIGLRAIAQHDPVIEYKREGFTMFEGMVDAIQDDTLNMLFHLSVEKRIERKQTAQPTSASHGGEAEEKKPVRAGEKVGRNAPCPCGSGKKYKNCHGRTA